MIWLENQKKKVSIEFIFSFKSVKPIEPDRIKLI